MFQVRGRSSGERCPHGSRNADELGDAPAGVVRDPKVAGRVDGSGSYLREVAVLETIGRVDRHASGAHVDNVIGLVAAIAAGCAAVGVPDRTETVDCKDAGVADSVEITGAARYGASIRAVQLADRTANIVDYPDVIRRVNRNADWLVETTAGVSARRRQNRAG